MTKVRSTFLALATLVIFLALASATSAQVTRTFVSSLGSDGLPCDSPLLPCRNISTAISKVQAGGEVVVITSGSYQPFGINKAVSVVAAQGVHVGITVASGQGAVINIGPADKVVLRGLTFNWTGGTNNNGIEFNAGAALHVEGCVVNGFPGTGILSSAASKLFVNESIVRNGGNFFGIVVGTQSGIVTAVISGCRVEGMGATGIGILAGDNSRVTIRDTTSSGNGTGFQADPNLANATVEMSLENCVAIGNSFAGIFADGSPGTSIVRVSNSTITNNNIGLTFNAGGSILTRGNNTVEGNNNDGFFTGPFTSK